MSRKRKTNSRDPRRPRRPRGHRRPADSAPPLIEATLAEMAAATGTSEAEVIADLDELEAARHMVRIATDDPGLVRAFLVFPDDYDRMRAAADFLATDKGKELEAWYAAWSDDPRVTDDAREVLKAITAGVIAGNGTYVTEEGVFTIGDDLEPAARDE